MNIRFDYALIIRLIQLPETFDSPCQIYFSVNWISRSMKWVMIGTNVILISSSTVLLLIFLTFCYWYLLVYFLFSHFSVYLLAYFYLLLVITVHIFSYFPQNLWVSDWRQPLPCGTRGSHPWISVDSTSTSRKIDIFGTSSRTAFLYILNRIYCIFHVFAVFLRCMFVC